MKTKTINQANFLFVVTGLLLVLVKWSALPDQVPLFYSRPWGEEQLAQKPIIFLLPAISLAVFWVNNLLTGRFLKDKNLFWNQAGDFISLTVSLLCLISLIKIITIIS